MKTVSLNLIELYFSKTDKRKNKAEITPSSFYLSNRPGFVDSIRENYKDYILKEKEVYQISQFRSLPQHGLTSLQQ